MKKIFIDETINVFEGSLAEEKLNGINDLKFLNIKEGGVHEVNEERWLSAQKYEKKTWMENNLSEHDDRNNEHIDRFNQLFYLKDKLNNSKVIELGCGPFTNIRLMTDILNVSEITLLDPLIDEYVNHPNCIYKNKTINGIPINIINSPIESFDTDELFDVVIIINVLEHCYNVDMIFEKIFKILKVGGILIFSDVYFDDVKTILYNIYDAGHPIKVSKGKIESFIKRFETIFDKRFHKLYSQDWRNDLYFVGKK